MGTPAFKAEANEFPMATHAHSTFRSDDRGRPALESIEVVGEAYPNFKLRFTVASKHVYVESRESVPYFHLIELVNKLNTTLNNVNREAAEEEARREAERQANK